MKTKQKITAHQIIKVNTLLSQLGLQNDKDQKKEIVRLYSAEGKESTAALYIDEAGEMISDLERQLSGKEPEPPGGWEADRKRKLLLHYAHLRGVKKENGKVDVERVNQWCITYGKYKKPLMQHSVAELSGIIYQAERAVEDFLNSI